MRIALRVWVGGKVQGVYYRQSTASQADALGVLGWVRNLADGRVEAWLEGEGTAVRALAEWMAQGPSAARVDSLEQVEQPAQELTAFRVLR